MVRLNSNTYVIASRDLLDRMEKINNKKKQSEKNANKMYLSEQKHQNKIKQLTNYPTTDLLKNQPNTKNNNQYAQQHNNIKQTQNSNFASNSLSKQQSKPQQMKPNLRKNNK